MPIQTTRDTAAWSARVTPYLLQKEAENNLILGLSSLLQNSPGFYNDFMLATLTAPSGELAGAALRTAPYNLILSHLTPQGHASLPQLAALLRSLDDTLPGVTASTAEAHAFASAWQAQTGKSCTIEMQQMIYELRTVIPPTGIREGRLHPVEPTHLELLTDWHHGFMRDAFVHTVPDRDASRRWAEMTLSTNARRIFFWMVNGTPVSMVGATGPTPNGIRIGPVYTPPALRGHGYASAATAALSQKMLDEGRTLCFLYTDAANPTSNKIYQAIGYHYVCDSLMVRFSPRE